MLLLSRFWRCCGVLIIKERPHWSLSNLRLQGTAVWDFEPIRRTQQDKGSLATIVRSAAVTDLHFVKLSALPAWLAWLFIHILFIVGFRNKLVELHNPK